jgi:hypothetical protein
MLPAVQLPSHLLSKGVKMTKYETVIFPVVLYRWHLLSHTNLRVSESRVLRRISGSGRDDVTRG